MKLNMDLIADALRQKFELVEVSAKHEDLLLEQVLLFAGDPLFLSGKVYVVEGKDLPRKPFFDGVCGVVSIGASEKGYLASECDYIELEEGVSIPEVLNCIQDAYEKYTKWNMKLHDALLHERGVQELLEHTLPLLENPVYLHDHDYHFIAYAEKQGMPGGNDIYSIKKNEGRFSLEAINVLKKTPNFEKTFQTTKPTFHIDTGECNYIYDNVWLKGKFWGRVYVDERVRPFKKGDYAIIGELRRIIEKALLSRNLSPGNHYRFLELEIVRMLESDSFDFNTLENELKKRRWDRRDSYFCFQIQMQDVDLLLNTIINTCELIEAGMADCITFPYKNNIVGIVCADNREDTMLRILRILSEFKLHAGVSLIFNDFRNFPTYYKQTGIALKYGMEEKKSQLIHCFEDYSFSYILDCFAKEMSPYLVYPPALCKLIDHDREKSTSYVATLRAYLENDSSPAQAVKELFVQRSTFLYRLNRINEIMGVDLKDRTVKIHFLIAFQLMDVYDDAQTKTA